jgi:MHS family proline/betaine transporter-like MFS transporter
MQNGLSRNVVISCFLAACLEIYDFTLFGFLGAEIHKNYLSFMDAQTAVIVTYAFFGIGFVVRPIGSLVFGYIGDTQGRKKALVLSVSFMGLASLSMSILPSYEAIGILSCYIIVVIRIIQGLSVGGEYSGAIIYAVEHFDKKKAGFVGGIVIAGCTSGVLLATLVSKIVQSSFMPEYAWRFAFLLGFALSIVGYFVRKRLFETPEFLKIRSSKEGLPLISGVKKYFRECVGSIVIAAANGTNFYLILVFLPNYINQSFNISSSYFPILTTSILVLFAPLFSWYSDYIGRAKMLGAGLLGTAVWGYVGIQLLSFYPSQELAILFFVVHALLYALQAGTANVFIVEIFPVKYRYSCAALCYSLGMGIVGGTSPMIASLLTSYSVSLLSYYMATVPMLGFLGLYWVIRGDSYSNIVNEY